MLTKEQYEAKRQARYERLIAAAERAERESQSTLDHAHQMADVIPFGQPILVGHYSEGRDRRYRARIDGKYRKGFELSERAAELRSRADSMAKNDAIFSDDPEAIEKIGGKIAQLEARQETMKAANKLVRKQDRAGLEAMGFTAGQVAKLFTPDFAGRLGFPDYEITNNGANIRRLKQRQQVIAVERTQETTEKAVNGVRIVDNAEDNRLQMFFAGKPAETVRQALKHAGFRWTPSLGCWQAYRNPNARYFAEKIAGELPAA
jgi:hypothetical protein